MRLKACQDEWRANKDANQAAGVTEKAYVDKCRAGGAAAVGFDGAGVVVGFGLEADGVGFVEGDDAGVVDEDGEAEVLSAGAIHQVRRLCTILRMRERNPPTGRISYGISGREYASPVEKLTDVPGLTLTGDELLVVAQRDQPSLAA